MQICKTKLLGAVAAFALLGAGTAFAQSGPGVPVRTIEVPQGSLVLVLPPPAALPAVMLPGAPASAAAVLDAELPFVPAPDPARLVARMDRMMSRMQRLFATPFFAAPEREIMAALRTAPPGGMVRGVVITTFSNGQGSCTRTVTYAGGGAAPRVEVRQTGGVSCSRLPSAPVSVPTVPEPTQPAPRLWQADYRSSPPAPTPRYG
jgi:hypothetical protein